MPLPSSGALAASLMSACNAPANAANTPFFNAMADTFLTAMKAATVTVNVTGTIVGTCPAGAVAGTCTATGTGVVS